MQKPYEAIVRLLDEAHIQYEKFVHEPVFTSEEAAAVRGVSTSKPLNRCYSRRRRDSLRSQCAR